MLSDVLLPDDQYGGVLGHNSGLFVTSGEDMMKALKEADGNEMGAWTKYYIPGGFTSGNQAEAVIDSVPRGEYQVMKFNKKVGV